MSGSISMAQAVERLTGGRRSDAQMAKGGATVAIRQIAALRHQLDRLEQCCRHTQKTGKPRKDDESVWRQAMEAADLLLEDMA